MCKDLYFVLLVFFAFIIGSISHESDLSRNFKQYGDAKAWFFDIKVLPQK